MGMFSWLTSDTGKSICNSYSSRETFTIYMKDNKGNVWREDDYSGYGEFGGKDYYELLAEMNGLTDRVDGIAIEGDVEKMSPMWVTKRNDAYRRSKTLEMGDKAIVPILVENKDIEWSEDLAPKNCPEQGYFYDDYWNED